MANHAQSQVIDEYKKLIMRSLLFVRVTQGMTDKARSYSHIFVDGKWYGGKLGVMLCRKPYKRWQLFGAHERLADLCPKCKSTLDKLAKVVIRMRMSELYAVAGGEKPEPLTQPEVLQALISLREANQPQEQPTPQEVMAMFEPEEINAEVRMTSLCRVPQPLLPSANTAP